MHLVLITITITYVEKSNQYLSILVFAKYSLSDSFIIAQVLSAIYIISMMILIYMSQREHLIQAWRGNKSFIPKKCLDMESGEMIVSVHYHQLQQWNTVTISNVYSLFITDTHSCQVFFLENLFNLLKKVVLVQKCFLLFPIMLSIRLKLQSFPWIYHHNL